MSATDIIIERETANDESGILVKIHVKSGEFVAKETLLFEVENSKAVQEVWSPHAGILKHDLEPGQTVEFGVPLARILDADSAADASAQSEHTSVASSTPAHAETAGPARAHVPPVQATGREEFPMRHYSRAAAALLARHPLPESEFESDFVTSRDVLSKLGLDKPAPGSAPPREQPKKAAPSVPESGRPLASHKRTEIEALSRGAGNSMLSVLGVSLGPLEIARASDDFLNGRITDLVIYEASRLMKKFPRLNAAYMDTHIVEHEAVHAGLAMDNGSRLVVYGIQHADRATFPELSNSIADGVERYLNHSLTSAELSRATFTVTDLSEGELDFVLPLLPRGQSCILGITHSTVAGYKIYAGFDHRVTEGREVASFLGELRERLLTFAAAHKVKHTAQCHYCGRSADEAFKSKEKGLLKILDRDGNEYLCCASCWNGW